jgi:hypothetical protein
VLRCDRGAPTRTVTCNGKTKHRPRIKSIWRSYHQLDLPLPDEAEQRLVEYIRAVTACRGVRRKFSQVSFQRIQTQLDLRGVPHRGPSTVGEGNDHTIRSDPSRCDGERDVNAFDRVLQGQRPFGSIPLLCRHLSRRFQAGEDPHSAEDQHHE